MNQATTLVAQIDHNLCRALLETALATDEMYRQQLQQAVGRLEKVLPYLEVDGRWYQITRCLHFLGEACGRMRDHETAHTYLQQALQITRRQESKREQALTYSHLGVVFFYQHDLTQACTYSQQAVALFEQIGDLWRAGRTANNVGYVLHHLGRQEEALAWTEQSITWLKRTQSIDLGLTFDTLGCIHFTLGNYPAARQAQKEALHHAEKHQRAIEQIDALVNLVAIELAEEQVDVAETWLQQAQRLITNHHAIPDELIAKSTGVTGLLHAYLGHEDDAREATERALQLFEAAGDQHQRAQFLQWMERLQVV